MQDLYDYRKFAVLYVDDEEKSLKLFARAFGETFRILTAANAKDGLQLLETQQDVGLLMTDQQMPGEKGVWLLERARQLQPRLVRILVTAYTDMDAAIEAVNSGAIYKYVTKPWDPARLEQTLKRGLEFFMVQRERDQLLREKMSVLHNMMIADRIVSLGLLAAGLSHHIRNALVAVKTFLDLAPAKMQDEKQTGDSLRHPEFWREYYGNVQGQIQKINTLLTALGSASDESSSLFQDNVDLQELLQNVVASLTASLTAKKMRVILEIPALLPTMKVDGPKFRRLFELLLKDELASLPEESVVSISAKAVPAPNSSGAIEVQIRDNGPGLPRENLRLLFDPFVARTESPSEYGINLMACYFIVHHHGGKIRAESTPAHGTVFTLDLPVNPKEVPPLEENPEFLRKIILNEMLRERLASE
jgi:two-component system, probable response regulator PhcQ